MSFMIKLDDLIRESIFQPIVNWLEPYITKEKLSYRLLLMAVMSEAIGMMIRTVGSNYEVLNVIGFFFFSLAAFFLLTIGRRFKISDTAERFHPSSVVNRMIWLFFTIWAASELPIKYAHIDYDDFGQIGWFFFNFFFLCQMYINSCMKPPPREKKYFFSNMLPQT